jgi:hypothetical protein
MTHQQIKHPDLTPRDIAIRIMRAIGTHEMSYVRIEGPTLGEYTRDYRQCFEEAFDNHPIAELCYYANHWTNDLQEWCRMQIGGKDATWEDITRVLEVEA